MPILLKVKKNYWFPFIQVKNVLRQIVKKKKKFAIIEKTFTLLIRITVLTILT